MCPVVEQICVVADSRMTSVVALVVPNEAGLVTLAKKAGVQELKFKELCGNVAVVNYVLKELTNHGLKCECFICCFLCFVFFYIYIL